MTELNLQKNRRILIIDDNRAIHDDFKKILSPGTVAGAALDAAEAELFGKPANPSIRQTHYEIDSAYQGQEGVMLVKKALAEGRPYALAFVDIRMPPGWDGVETTQFIWKVDPEVQIVLCTAYADYSWEDMFQKIGNSDGLVILKKPFDTVEALQLAQAFTEKWSLQQQARRKMDELERLVAARTSALAEANQQLQQQTTELRVLFDYLPAMIVFKDTQNGILRVNKLLAQNLGKPVAEIEGKPSCEVFPQHADKYFKDDLEVIQSGTPKLGIVEAMQDRNGNELTIQTDKVPVFDPDRNVTGIIVMAQDISERQRSETALLESKRFLRSTLDALTSHIAILDEQGTIIEVNAAWHRFANANRFVGNHGVGDNYLAACTSAVGSFSEESLKAAAGIRTVMSGQCEDFSLEYPCHSPQEQRWFTLRVTRFGGDGPVRVVVAHENITQRKQAENAMRESNEKFHQLANNITDVFWVRSPDLSELHYLSPAFERIWGRSVASLQADPHQWISFILPEDRERVEGAFAELKGNTRSLEIEYRITRPDGEIRWVHVRGFQVRNAADELIRHAGIVTDITDRKKAEARLARTEELYRQAITAAEAVPYASDYRTKTYRFMGAGIEQLIGYAPHEVSGQLWNQIIEESVMGGEAAELTKAEAARRMMFGELRTWRCDMRVRTRAGKLRWLSDTAVQQFDDAGRPDGSMGILQDITERKQAEIISQAFAKLGQRLSSATSAREAFVIVGEVSRELFGWDAFWIYLYSEKSDLIYSGMDVDTINGKPVSVERNTSRRPSDLYRRILGQGGELILRDSVATPLPGTISFGDVARPSASLIFVPIRSQGRPVGILSVQSYTLQAYTRPDLRTLQTMADQCGGAFERIWADEALRLSEVQLFQAQKLETVGKLAGGIAHEFNSLLTAIIGQSELLLGDLPEGSPLTENATEIIKAADRAATLTRQLLAYGRKQFLQPEALNLNRVIANLEGVFRHLLGHNVEVQLVAAPELRLVKADAGQIEQVIMNLVVNARDAMPNGGKLTLETANVHLDAESVGRYPELKPGDYVLLAVSDTGTGMTAEVQARAFEPFFTTKGVGQGSGLGLSTCYGIIKQSGGHISVYSELSRGTTFKIYLPFAEAAVPPPPQRLDSPELPRGTETILLVEDDPALREMAATLLTRLGYTVWTAADGVEALGVQQERGTGHIDLLFTDVVMPHMSGRELADRVRALYPKTRILFTSAYTENAIVQQGVLDPGVALLQKPFTPSALARRVRGILDAGKDVKALS